MSDTGGGIKADQLPYIFDRFRQADGSASREYSGSGIGLALVKEIAALHGGTVVAHSQYGKGTTFHVTIPLGHAHLSPSSVVKFSEDDLAGRSRSRVLLIEDPDPPSSAGRGGALVEVEAVGELSLKGSSPI